MLRHDDAPAMVVARILRRPQTLAKQLAVERRFYAPLNIYWTVTTISQGSEQSNLFNDIR